VIYIINIINIIFIFFFVKCLPGDDLKWPKRVRRITTCLYIKGKSAPLQAWSGPECSRKLRLPDFMTTAQDSGKVVSLTHRPPLTPGNAPGIHFC